MPKKKISAYIHPGTLNDIKYIDVLQDNEQKRLTTKEEMEQALFIHHKEHLSHSSDTPYAAPEVISRFELAADTEYSRLFRLVNTIELTHWNNNIAT